MTSDRARDRLSLAIEHLQNAVAYGKRGRAILFDAGIPDTRWLVEAELRKAFESLNRQGDAFYHANPALDRTRIGELRQLLTHDYADVDPGVLWRILTEEVPPLLRRLVRARVPE